MAAFTPIILAIFLTGLVHKASTAEQCNGPRQLPIFGMKLQGHIYNKRYAPSGHAECLFVCREEDVCQSFNFVVSESVCEWNNLTKEASPENFVKDSDRYYVKLDVRRVPLGSISKLPAKSCKEIKANEGGQAVSGKYWFYSIIPETSVLAYCNMTTEDIDECSASPAVCHAKASCRKNVASYVCTCNPGFNGNGKICDDVNECTSGSHGCHANAVCTNTAGSYSCACNSAHVGNGTNCLHNRGLNSSSILGLYNWKYKYDLLSYLDPVLQSSSNSRFMRCWRAYEDGWLSSTFHSNCDGKGPTVTIIRVGSNIFGGYTDVSWASNSYWTYSSKSFIYSLYNYNRGYNPVKLRIKSGEYRYATYRRSDYGPTFGRGHGIYIHRNSQRYNSHTRCGYSYALPPGYSQGDCLFFTGQSLYFTPSDIEVFYEVT